MATTAVVNPEVSQLGFICRVPVAVTPSLSPLGLLHPHLDSRAGPRCPDSKGTAAPDPAAPRQSIAIYLPTFLPLPPLPAPVARAAPTVLAPAGRTKNYPSALVDRRHQPPGPVNFGRRKFHQSVCCFLTSKNSTHRITVAWARVEPILTTQNKRRRKLFSPRHIHLFFFCQLQPQPPFSFHRRGRGRFLATTQLHRARAGRID